MSQVNAMNLVTFDVEKYPNCKDPGKSAGFIRLMVCFPAPD
jgi:hypothetical protein